MNIRINFNLSDIIEALDVVSAVTPHATAGGTEGAGYLFVVKGKECFLYSSDEYCIARAKFDLLESSEDGAFVFPYINLSSSLRPLAKEEETCVIEATSDDDGHHTVKYITSPDGAEAEFGSFSPDSISRYDEDLERASETYEFNPGLLREAISLAKSFMADKEEQGMEAFRGVEVIDKTRLEKGDGYLYATDKFMAFYFKSEHFVGKKLAIHSRYISAFLGFLSKCGSDSTVTIKIGDKTFAINNKGDVFGWTKHNLHDKFNYHTLKMDSLVVRVNKARLLNALDASKGALKDKEQNDGIVFNYDAKSSRIWFDVPASKAKSIKIEATPITDTEEGTQESKADSFAAVVSAKQLSELVQSMKGYDITFRGYLGKPKADKKPLCLFRTIDEFYMDPDTGKPIPFKQDAIPCRVTRFMPSKQK